MLLIFMRPYRSSRYSAVKRCFKYASINKAVTLNARRCHEPVKGCSVPESCTFPEPKQAVNIGDLRRRNYVVRFHTTNFGLFDSMAKD